MITVPVVLDWDSTKPIGQLTIDETRIPSTPDWVLSLGYMAKDFTLDNGELTVNTYDLVQVSLLHDEAYMAYLDKQKGSRVCRNDAGLQNLADGVRFPRGLP